MRNQNPFTQRQIRLLEAIREKLQEVNDPDPEIITNESYEFYTETKKDFGQIPKLRFRPNSTRIKAEIIDSAGLIDESQKEKKAAIRAKFSIKKARNAKANLFESEWNNIMHKLKKATFTLAYINQLFATGSQQVADPIALLQSIIQEEYKDRIKAKEPIHDPGQAKPGSSYKDELMEAEQTE